MNLKCGLCERRARFSGMHWPSQNARGVYCFEHCHYNVEPLPRLGTAMQTCLMALWTNGQMSTAALIRVAMPGRLFGSGVRTVQRLEKARLIERFEMGTARECVLTLFGERVVGSLIRASAKRD